MKHVRNILIVLQDENDLLNDPALIRGLELAKLNRAQVTLMSVLDIPEYAKNQYKGIIAPEEFVDLLVKRRSDALQKVCDDIGSDVDTNIKVGLGKDFIEIVRQVVMEDHDLLIKVANKHEGSFDSSDFHIMRKCPKPVWLLKANADAQCKRVLAAIDLELESTNEGRALNRSIMDMASSLAEWKDCSLEVLSCWSLYGENSLRHSGFLRVSEDEVTALINKEEATNRERLNALVADFKYEKIHTHLIKGDAEKIIPKFTRDENTDVVVMGTVGRTGIPGLLIGNTSESILHKIHSSVITLKPEGFESPIK